MRYPTRLITPRGNVRLSNWKHPPRYPCNWKWKILIWSLLTSCFTHAPRVHNASAEIIPPLTDGFCVLSVHITCGQCLILLSDVVWHALEVLKHDWWSIKAIQAARCLLRVTCSIKLSAANILFSWYFKTKQAVRNITTLVVTGALTPITDW